MSLIKGDDGRPADEVGPWVKQKHGFLRYYVDTCRGVRRGFVGPKNAGATLIDLFCATGRARIRDTTEWVDGSSVAAWKKSVEGGAPFSAVYIADVNEEARRTCAERLKAAGAPVVELYGDAVSAAREVLGKVSPHGLHFAFIDPWNLGHLKFEIIEALSLLKRIDMLIHVSAMDLQRNLDINPEIIDQFAPLWRENVNLNASQRQVRADVIEYWKRRVVELGTFPTQEMRLITTNSNQRLYWLLLVAKHQLAHDFWSKAANFESQQTLL